MGNFNLSKVELLAPAGSYEAFVAAVNAGADAVYMGLKNFNARVMSNNFTIEEYIDAIDYAHKRDVKIYLTLNTLLLDEEIEQAIKQVYELYKVGLDGVIVQDLGVADILHKVMPDLSIHASTQMSVCTLEQVKMLENLGFSRVVLARELSIEEIKHIAQNTKLEIEVFVHGALCVSVSGQCLMSAMIGDRSANRGSCAGPCRKKYSLYKTNGKLVEKNKYLLSKKDIFGLDKLQKLIDAGICSLKIEGRNKTPEYVAGIVKNYREALENNYNVNQDKEVLQLFNRSGKSDGYLEGVRYRKSISENSPKNTGLYLGKVIATKKNYIKIKLNEKIDLHDGIECLGNNISSTVVTCIRDAKFNVINKLSKIGSIVWLGDINASVGDNIYKTSSSALNKKYNKYCEGNIKKLEYDVLVTIRENKKIMASVANTNVFVETEYIPQISKSTSVNHEKVKEAFSKTEETSVKFNVSCDIQEGLFVPTSKLNELRKLLVEKIEKTKIVRKEIEDFTQKTQQALIVNKDNDNNIRRVESSLYVYKYNKNMDYIDYYKEKYGNNLDVIYINPGDFAQYEEHILQYLDKCKVCFAIPNVTLKNMTKYINTNLERLCQSGISGILLGNLGYISLCKELKERYNVEIIADYSLNIMNKYTANKLKELGIDKVTPIFENDNIRFEGINEIIPVEIVHDMVTVMTTRYCIIASFAKNADENSKCEAECRKNDYYIIDELNKRYDILTDSFDCISRYIRNKRPYVGDEEKTYSNRHCILN